MTHQPDAPVHVWEKQELTFQAQRSPANPYTDVEVWVDLQGPGFQKRVYGFWDGGQTFKVRLLATAPGAWRWVSGSNQDDPGLNGHTGGLTALPWSEAELQANPCRRGFLQPTPNGHALQYADGTPCFLLVDTWWAAPTFRFPWHDDDLRRPLGPGMGFKDMVQYRRAQGLNGIAILAALPAWANDGYPAHIRLDDAQRTGVRDAWPQAGTASAKDMHNEGGRPFLFPGRVPGYEQVFPDVERLNPAYFQAMDRKIDYLNAQGMIPFIEVARRDVGEAWRRFYPWPDSYTRYIQYVWSRYQAHNALLSPIHFDWNSMTIPSRAYNEPANQVIARYGPPPFGTLVSANSQGSTLLNFGNADEAPWLTLHQTGNLREHHNYWFLTEIYHESQPPRPALNGEPYYAGFPRDEPPAGSEEDTLNCRSGMYGSFLSGGLAGHFYGAQGLWGGDIEPEARHKTWEALAYPSGAQLQHLRTFALSEGPRYQELVPQAECVYPNKSGAWNGYRGWAYCARTPDKHLFMLYFERDCPPATVRGARHERTYRATWFDPRTGNWLDAGNLTADTLGRLTLPAFPSDEDWALKLVLEP